MWIFQEVHVENEAFWSDAHWFVIFRVYDYVCEEL